MTKTILILSAIIVSAGSWFYFNRPHLSGGTSIPPVTVTHQYEDLKKQAGLIEATESVRIGMAVGIVQLENAQLKEKDIEAIVRHDRVIERKKEDLRKLQESVDLMKEEYNKTSKELDWDAEDPEVPRKF